MNRIVKNALLLAFIILPSVYACSQPPVPAGAPPPAGPPGIAGPGRTPPPPPPGGPGDPAGAGARTLQQLVTVQGTVNAYTANDNNEYDGLTLQSGGQSLNVRFAPHMAEQLMATAKAGVTINIQGFYETTPEGLNVIHLVNATAGSRTIYDSPPTPPTSAPEETIETFSGTITDLRRDRMGNPNGILLSGSRVIDLTPDVYNQLQTSLKPGTSLTGSGTRATPPPGVVLAQNIQTIHPQTLTINGQTYMVR